MQTSANNPSKSALDGSYSSMTQDQSLNLQLLTPNEETPNEGHNWLSKELKRLPYQLYRFWLFLGLCSAVTVLYVFFRDLWAVYEYLTPTQIKYFFIAFAFPNINHVLLFFGCAQMLFGMMKKKTRIAKSGLTKFQIIMISSTIYITLQISAGSIKFNFTPIGILRTFVLPGLVTVNILGALAVIKAFKKSHPLERHDSNFSKDFLHQNEVLRTELVKYDEQLERWPYLIYKLWLSLSLIFEILLFVGSILEMIEELTDEEGEPGFPIFHTVCFGLNVICSTEMIYVLRRRVLARSRRAKLLLKLCILLTLIMSVALSVMKEKTLVGFVYDLTFYVCIPIINLIGAVFVHKILEERHKIINALSYNDVSYL